MLTLWLVLGIVAVLLAATAGQHRRHSQQTDPHLCRACGMTHPAHARYCRRCGRQLD